MYLKSLPNTTAVPSHWLSKRKFLSSKRNQSNVTYQLPSYLKATNIESIRDNHHNNTKSLKQLQKEKIRPKTQEIILDYQALYDAFLNILNLVIYLKKVNYFMRVKKSMINLHHIKLAIP